ncbi:hypothetical protein [Streptomyces sp. NPDC050263]
MHDGDVVGPEEIPAFLAGLALVRTRMERTAAETCLPNGSAADC